jgi:DNA (cytosine-5)-methyltransferase 1
MQCKWQVEIDPYCQKVLDQQFPGVGQWDDVRTFPPGPASDWSVDVICGGFPCQDISIAGKGAGIDGERSGLWSEYSRIVRVLRPRIVVVENVAALLNGGMDRVLGDLAACGYDAEWDCLPAAAFGANHFRDRVFLVAHSQIHIKKNTSLSKPKRLFFVCEPGRDSMRAISRGHWETGKPGLIHLDDGISEWASGVGALGNAVVPQIAEWIGRRIMEAVTPEGASE